jgi:hypothetical protein
MSVIKDDMVYVSAINCCFILQLPCGISKVSIFWIIEQIFLSYLFVLICRSHAKSIRHNYACVYILPFFCLCTLVYLEFHFYHYKNTDNGALLWPGCMIFSSKVVVVIQEYYFLYVRWLTLHQISWKQTIPHTTAGMCAVVECCQSSMVM